MGLNGRTRKPWSPRSTKYEWCGTLWIASFRAIFLACEILPSRVGGVTRVVTGKVLETRRPSEVFAPSEGNDHLGRERRFDHLFDPDLAVGYFEGRYSVDEA